MGGGGGVGGSQTNVKAHKLPYTVHTLPAGWENPNRGGHVKLGATTEVLLPTAARWGAGLGGRTSESLKLTTLGAHTARARALRKYSSYSRPSAHVCKSFKAPCLP